jgi:LPPG:FO 2-phospho-L-lactate transferase
LPRGDLSIVVNVGDDEYFHGLTVCPDLDTVTYTLSGLVHAQQGWGVAGDTAHAIGMLRRLKAPDTWMHLGDADIGLHLFRSQCLAQGKSLSGVTRLVTEALGTPANLIPASDDPAPTLIETKEEVMRFQQWFVARRATPAVRRIRYSQGRASDSAIQVMAEADLIVIAPSNPLLSIEPMLALSGMRDALLKATARRVAVSPLIGGRAVKGPLGKMLTDLNIGHGNKAIASIYSGLVDLLVIDSIDERDRDALPRAGIQDILVADTGIADRGRSGELAIAVLQACGFAYVSEKESE